VVDKLSACGCGLWAGGRVDIRGRLKVKVSVVCRAYGIVGRMVREGWMGVLIVVGWRVRPLSLKKNWVQLDVAGKRRGLPAVEQ